MPVVIVESPNTLDTVERQQLAEALTATISQTRDVPPEKVQIFIGPGIDAAISIHALGSAGKDEPARVHSAIRPYLQAAMVSVHDYRPDHTARGGILRTA